MEGNSPSPPKSPRTPRYTRSPKSPRSPRSPTSPRGFKSLHQNITHTQDNLNETNNSMNNTIDTATLSFDDEEIGFVVPKPSRGHTIKLAQFGSFSPSWTIGSSRRVTRIPDDMPGPSDYDIRYNKPRGCLISTSRSLDSSRTLTSDLDYSDSLYKSDFGNPKRGASIGIRKDTIFWIPTQSPPIIYDSKSTLSAKSCRIHERPPPQKPSATPGPGYYEPRVRPTYKLLTIDRKQERDVFKNPEPNNPGPGAYQVVKLPGRAPTWFKNKRITKMDDEEESSYGSSRNSNSRW
ncbi:hypothetical protein TRFO_06217 [Tritrichomonas foetus]|uniref:Uncharacterized protein n=1 Tax=Tritrichomonas foetus TaxID=1144522 RepID=A0A1J4K0J7_9EUKA|nr:hypothetical protein TRFO_06217 [Tritrichomonas foetus]|eukprot:OHT04771.1 hypothetical protein TRFO_06217 [Tritrichomonas foetus]